MQVTSKGLFRSVMTGALALGFMGTAAISTPVSAQGVVCVLNPALELADVAPADGIVTIDEIDRVIRLSGNNADLQAARDAAVNAGVTGIQYTGCTPEDGTTDPGDGDGTTDPGDGDGTTDPGDGDGTTDPGDGDGTTDPGDGDGTTDPGDGDGTTDPGDGDGTTGGGDGVSELPDTGSGVAESNTTGWIMMSVGSLMAAAGAFIFRAKKA